MRPNTIAVLLGLGILVECHPILNSIDSHNINTIRTRDVPNDTSSQAINALIGALGPIVLGLLNNAPILKRSPSLSDIKDVVRIEHRKNRRGNPSPPATLDDDEADTIIGKRGIPDLAGGIIIGEHDENFQSNVKDAARRESEGQSPAGTPSPATLDKRAPETLSLVDGVLEIVIGEVEAAVSHVKRDSFDLALSADNPSSHVTFDNGDDSSNTENEGKKVSIRNPGIIDLVSPILISVEATLGDTL